MLRLVSLLTILFTAALATAAQATPTPSFTVSDSPTVGIPVTFDATATVCDAEPCGYTWRILDGSRLGITFGRTPVARYTFDEPGLVAVQLRVVNSNPRIGGPSAREASLVQSFTVAPGTAPRCPDASLTTRPGVPVALPADPCSHPAGNPNDAVGAPAPAHGQVVDGSYVPEPGFHGVDELTYQVADRVTGERSNVATVRVLVDTAPVCADLALTVEPGQTLALTAFPPCSDPDGDALAVATGDPLHGTLARDPTSGAATYTPAPGYTGTDTITYHAVDAFGLAAGGTLTIGVGVPVPDPAPPAPGPPAAPGPPDPAPAAASVKAGGLRLRLATSEAGVARVTVTLDRATARRLKVARRAGGRVTVASRTTRVRRGSTVVVVRLRAAARRALRHAGRVRLRVTVRLTDAAGNRTVHTATVTLRARRPR